MRTRTFMLGAILALCAVLGGSEALRAAQPTVTISSPTKGSSIKSTSLTVTGSFRADTSVKNVSVVLCTLSSSNRCQQYVQNASGQLGPKWRSVNASLSSSNAKSGGYTLKLSGLPAAKYQVAAFAADQKTAKGPRAYSQVTLSSGTTPPPSGDGKGYVTIMWARSNWQATYDGCQTAPGTRTLEQNAQDMRARGMTGVGGVVVDRTKNTGTSCFAGYTLQASWEKLAMLRDTYGWSFVSQGMEYKDMTQMTNDTQRRYESLDTLPILKTRGHNNAWGAFNFANNKQDAAAQRIVWQGFAFGRKYGDGINKKSTATSTRIMNTNSINGGRCNNPSLPCYNMKVVSDRRSTSLDVMKKVMNPSADGWGVIQFYRLVEGKRGSIGDGFAWDCSSSDWRDRWTSQPELTCRETFLQVLDSKSPNVVVTDPASVARAWGVTPSNQK